MDFSPRLDIAGSRSSFAVTLDNSMSLAGIDLFSLKLQSYNWRKTKHRISRLFMHVRNGAGPYSCKRLTLLAPRTTARLEDPVFSAPLPRLAAIYGG